VIEGSEESMTPTTTDIEILTIEDGMLFKANGELVMPETEADKQYRTAYRAYFGYLGAWPPDGEYEFHAKGRYMRPRREKIQ